jgi:hypothetical protein
MKHTAENIANVFDSFEAADTVSKETHHHSELFEQLVALFGYKDVNQ